MGCFGVAEREAARWEIAGGMLVGVVFLPRRLKRRQVPILPTGQVQYLAFQEQHGNNATPYIIATAEVEQQRRQREDGGLRSGWKVQVSLYGTWPKHQRHKTMQSGWGQ